MSGCPFCALNVFPAREVLRESDHSLSVFDAFPSAPGHALCVPRRHVSRLLDLSEGEHVDLFSVVRATLRLLETRFGPDAFTLGVNDGPAAGQTVPHVHVHLLPRTRGDVPDPRGGVRWVLPGTAAYWT